MKATLTGRYEVDKSSATAALSAAAGDVRLKASITDATFAKGPSLSGLALSLEKPGSFIIDYNVPNQDVRFQFMNSVRLLEKQVNLTYTHARGEDLTEVDGTVVFDPANKMSASYEFGSGDCKVKYAYAYGEEQRMVLEPSYDFSKNAWDFAATRRFEGGDAVKATYRTSSKVLGVEWIRDSKINGCFKIHADKRMHFSPYAIKMISASVNLADQNIVPKVVAESTWNYEI